MAVVVSNRVKAGPNDRLPPGATEAEFAFHMARAIRRGLDRPIRIEDIVIVSECRSDEPEPAAEIVLAGQPSRRVEKAIAGVKVLVEWAVAKQGITEAEVAMLLGRGQDWIKHLRQRDRWAVISEHGPRRPAVYYIASVIETARRQVQEAINQQKRGGRERYSTREK